jgi:CrcB protein
LWRVRISPGKVVAVKRFIEFFAIGGAGFFGAIARYSVGLLIAAIFGTAFPIGTLVINITACFMLGWFISLASHRWVIPDALRLAIAVGFIGTYSTFSTFVFESNALFEAGEKWSAMLNLAASIVLGLFAVRLGILVANRI